MFIVPTRQNSAFDINSFMTIVTTVMTIVTLNFKSMKSGFG